MRRFIVSAVVAAAMLTATSALRAEDKPGARDKKGAPGFAHTVASSETRGANSGSSRPDPGTPRMKRTNPAVPKPPRTGRPPWLKIDYDSIYHGDRHTHWTYRIYFP